MKILNRLLLAFSIGVVYLLSDIFLSFFLKNSGIDIIYIRVVISTILVAFSILFSYLFLPNSFNKEKNSSILANQRSHKYYSLFNKINKALMSNSFSLDNRLKKVADLIKKHYDFGAVLISLEKDGKLEIVNYDNEIKDILGSKVLYDPNEKDDYRSTLSKIIANQYLKQIGFSIRKIEPSVEGDLNIWGIVNIGLISKNNSKLVGLVTLFLKDRKNFTEEIEEDIKIIVDDLSFFVCFNRQKELMQKEYERNKKDLEFSNDLDLHISKQSVVNKFLNAEVKRASRYNSKLSILIFQIDNLANIYNAFSEEVALNVKKELVRLVERNIRELDTLGMWSNNRFIIIAPETDGDGAYQFAEKLMNDINATRFKDVNKITCSFGISWLVKDPTNRRVNISNIEIELIRRAETALLQAIETGGNKIVFM